MMFALGIRSLVVYKETYVHVSLFMKAVAPAIKRDFPGRKVEPLQYFNCYVRSNLCLLFPLPSDHDLMNKWAK